MAHPIRYLLPLLARTSWFASALALACGGCTTSACPSNGDADDRAQFVIEGGKVFQEGTHDENGERRHLRVLEGAEFVLESATPTCGPSVTLGIRSADPGVVEVLEVAPNGDRALSARLRAASNGTTIIEAIGDGETVGWFALDVVSGSLELEAFVQYSEPGRDDWEGSIEGKLSLPLASNSMVFVHVRSDAGGRIEIPRNNDTHSSGVGENAADWSVSNAEVASFGSLYDILDEGVTEREGGEYVWELRDTIEGSIVILHAQSVGTTQVEVTFAGIEDVASFELTVTEPESTL